jgi:hypothetical protein
MLNAPQRRKERKAKESKHEEKVKIKKSGVRIYSVVRGTKVIPSGDCVTMSLRGSETTEAISSNVS